MIFNIKACHIVEATYSLEKYFALILKDIFV